MLPKPLLWMLANPALDHRGDGLHRALNIDAAFIIARQLERFSHFAPKSVSVRLANQADAPDRAFHMTREVRDQRIGLAGPPEEGHIDTAPVMLVDEHPDVLALLKPAGQTHRRRVTSGDQRAHAAGADLDDGITDRANAGRAVER